MTGLEVLCRELALPDEWQLGGGGRVVFAPQTPVALALPGFRDAGRYLSQPINPVFAVDLLDPFGKHLPLRAAERNWTPARLQLRYQAGELAVIERRTVLSFDALVSRFSLEHSACVAQRYWLVLWTRRPNGMQGRTLADVEANPRGVSFQEAAVDAAGNERARWGCAMGASYDADSWSVDGAESAGLGVDWPSTPFFDLVAPGGLPGHFADSHGGPAHLFFALAYPLEIPPGEKLTISFACCLAADVETARTNLERCGLLIDPVQASEEEWIAWFEDVPSFTCSNRLYQRAYWYRWAQRRIWRGADENAGVASGQRGAKSPVGRVVDNTWHHNSEQATDELRGLLTRPDAADLATAHAARRVLSLHPESDLQYELSRRCGKLLSDGAEPIGALRIAPARAPWNCEFAAWTGPSLTRSLCAFDLLRLLDWLESDHPTADRQWTGLAKQLRSKIVREFWDYERRFFVERLPAVGGDRSASTSAGFLALLVGLADAAQSAWLREHLFDPEEFWTAGPLPSLSRNDPEFSPDGRWRNCRLDRPWHGRAWLEAASHVVDGLGRGVELANHTERAQVVSLVDRLVCLDFPHGDADRPACHEHYNPLTGRPAEFLGRSEPAGWMIDHLLRYVGGVRPNEQGLLVVDPLPFGLEWFSVNRIYVGDHEVDVQWDHRGGLTVRIDEQHAGHAAVGHALSVQLQEA